MCEGFTVTTKNNDVSFLWIKLNGFLLDYLHAVEWRFIYRLPSQVRIDNSEEIQISFDYSLIQMILNWSIFWLFSIHVIYPFPLMKYSVLEWRQHD